MGVKENAFKKSDAKYEFSGMTERAFEFIEDFQISDKELWARFVRQFAERPDGVDRRWRGEYWGKMMRGACMVYAYRRDAALLETLTGAVHAIMDTADDDGRISTYTRETEFTGWDLWCRKYVMLGMLYFLDICPDADFRREVTASLVRQADYLTARLGFGEDGKKKLYDTAILWRGLSAASILEPFVKLYRLTGKRDYLNFAKKIVDSGCTTVENIFELAYKDELSPYQYPVTKAYEMISCFEGLLEYYIETGDEKHKLTLTRFADRVLATDFTVIGSSGCWLEQFDHSTNRQANTTNGSQQETCVTVTLMKFMARLAALTGESRYADAVEISYYNAYLGAINFEKAICTRMAEGVIEDYCNGIQYIKEPMPFSSYSPLTAGTRDSGIGGFNIMSDAHYYGCCACIGAAGMGIVPYLALMKTADGLVLNMYIGGRAETDIAVLCIDTDYPRSGSVKITVHPKAESRFELALRKPGWCENAAASVNGEQVCAEGGYIRISRDWRDGDTVELAFDMPVRVVRPVSYGTDILMTKMIWDYDYIVPVFDREDPLAKKHIALCRGPITFGADSAAGFDFARPAEILAAPDGTAYAELLPPADGAQVTISVKTAAGSLALSDYASAGRPFAAENLAAAWILNER